MWHTQCFEEILNEMYLPHPVSQFHHAPCPSHCFPSNPSYPAPFQVTYQDSNIQPVAIMFRYSRYPFTETVPSLTQELISLTQTPQGSAASDVSCTNSPDPFQSGSEIFDVFQEWSHTVYKMRCMLCSIMYKQSSMISLLKTKCLNICSNAEQSSLANHDRVSRYSS